MNAFPSRRELREQRERATAKQSTGEPAAESAPVVAPASGPAPTASVATTHQAPARRSKAKRSHPVISALTIVAIPGIFLTAGLPAYAFAPGESPVSHAAAHGAAPAQGVTVAASAANVRVARVGLSATTPH
jgi:hypothetical protein